MLLVLRATVFSGAIITEYHQGCLSTLPAVWYHLSIGEDTMSSSATDERGSMAQATLTRILNELKTLEPEELRQVQRVVEEQLASTLATDPDEQVLQAMLKVGLITEIKRPDRHANPERPAVPILGKPLSETIIEERR